MEKHSEFKTNFRGAEFWNDYSTLNISTYGEYVALKKITLTQILIARAFSQCFSAG